MFGCRKPALALIVAMLAACGGVRPADGEADPVLARDDFVEVYVELRRAAALSNDQDDYEERKQAIFDRHGVGDEDLYRFLRHNRDDLGKLAAVWSEIEQRLREPLPDAADEAGATEPELEEAAGPNGSEAAAGPGEDAAGL